MLTGPRTDDIETYPDMINSSSKAYNFICCKPHPSLIRFGTTLFLKPVRFGVWKTRSSTRSSPNSSTNGASNDAQHGFGFSLVPLRASVMIDILRSGFLCNASRSTDIYTIISMGSLIDGRKVKNIPAHTPSFPHTMSTDISSASPSISYPTSPVSQVIETLLAEDNLTFKVV